MESRYDESNKITILSIIWNIVLTVIKISAGVLGNSNAIIADGLHSASDILTSIGVLIGNKISKSPNDKEHNYGHEKAETLVALLLSIVLIFVALKIGYGGIISLINIDKIKVPTILPLIVSVISILIKEYQYRITIKVANKINSPALKADAWHHRSDALSSIAAFIGIGGAIIGFKILDSLASIVVALFVSKVGLDILLKSANELMDLSIGKEYEDKIISIAKNTQGVEDILDLRTRKYGSMAYVDLVICVDKNLTVYKGHDIASNLEDIILKNMDFIKGITVHVEPYLNENKNSEN